jgi:soluble lytic murein transglycosylase-like protein
MIQGDQPETQDLRNDQLETSQSREQYSYIENQPDLLLEQNREDERASQAQKSGLDTFREDSKRQASDRETQGMANSDQQQALQQSAQNQQSSAPTSQPPVIELRANPPLPMSAQQIMFKPRTESQNTPVDETLLDAIRWVESRDGKYTKSPAGALGDYQFMPKTAKAYGVNLYDNDPTDDREGARKLLIDEHGALGEMALAIAAYNAGRPAITRAQAKAEKAGMGSDFVSILPFLPEETRNYVPLVYEAIDRLKSRRA